MDGSYAVTAAIIEQISPARTALHQLLTHMGLRDIFTSDKIGPSSSTDLLFQYSLIFVGWHMWDDIKSSFLHSLYQKPSEEKPKILLFLSSNDPLDVLEAVQMGIDGYITYPFSLHDVRQKIYTVLPHHRLPEDYIHDSSAWDRAPQKKTLSQQTPTEGFSL